MSIKEFPLKSWDMPMPFVDWRIPRERLSLQIKPTVLVGLSFSKLYWSKHTNENRSIPRLGQRQWLYKSVPEQVLGFPFRFFFCMDKYRLPQRMNTFYKSITLLDNTSLTLVNIMGIINMIYIMGIINMMQSNISITTRHGDYWTSSGMDMYIHWNATCRSYLISQNLLANCSYVFKH